MKEKLLPAVLAGLSCISTAATAADDYSMFDPPIDFLLQFANQKFDLDYGGGTLVDSKMKRVGIAWRERYFDRVQLGAIAGISELTQTNNPATAGQKLDGYHYGVTVDVDLYRNAR